MPRYQYPYRGMMGYYGGAGGMPHYGYNSLDEFQFYESNSGEAANSQAGLDEANRAEEDFSNAREMTPYETELLSWESSPAEAIAKA